MNLPVAFLGTGLMGAPMAGKLIDAGFKLTVYNRTSGKTETLKKAGATVAPSPAAAIASGTIIVTMLSDYQALLNVLLKNPAPIFKGKTVLQMGTILPEESTSLCQAIEAGGGEYIEAPVLGSLPQVKSGSLFIFAAGNKKTLDKVTPLLNLWGQQVLHLGDVGRAAAIKLAFNQLIVSLTTSFSMSLAYLQQLGIPSEPFMEVLRQSALYAPTFDKKLERMQTGDFSKPNFPLKHMLKDSFLIREAFAIAGINTSILQGIQDILIRAMLNGSADLDYSALFKEVRPGISKEK